MITSPGAAAERAFVSDAASVTLFACGIAGSFGTARVVPVTVFVALPPSGSVAVSSISYDVAG
ncbi:MAG TPA: hypothetical protein VH062_01735 [Polyangiaceae bacterium]|nr:hypothetical protein [Polyangiaceae bacterium]